MQPLVQVTVSEQQLATLEEGFARYYDLYQRLHLQFYVLLMVGAMDTQNT